MPLTNFAGTVAVITGGASGTGLATARALHSRGAHIVLADINEDQRDLTLASNPDIAYILQIYTDDPDKAEKLLGEAYARRVHSSDEQRAVQGSQQ